MVRQKIGEITKWQTLWLCTFFLSIMITFILASWYQAQQRTEGALLGLKAAANNEASVRDRIAEAKATEVVLAEGTVTAINDSLSNLFSAREIAIAQEKFAEAKATADAIATEVAVAKIEAAEAEVRAAKAATELESARTAIELARASVIATIFTTVVSVIGFASTTFLSWRKERREEDKSRLELEQERLELEKAKIELELQKQKLGNKKSTTKR